MANVDSITVRMYNTGSVGDCLLLLFKKQGTVSFKMLIDCGGYNTKSASITKCVKDIRTAIVDDTLDLVVVTHEHEDHVSGFNQSRAEFDNVTFKNVWMAWTENPYDPLAKKLKKEKALHIKAIREDIARQRKFVEKQLKKSISRDVRSTLVALQHEWAALGEALDYEEGLPSPNLKALNLTVADAMKYVKRKCKATPKSRIYRKPGDVLENMQGAEGIRFHFLGPPYDQDFHGILNTEDESEMYAMWTRMGFQNFSAYRKSIGTAGLGSQAKSPFHRKYVMQGSQVHKFNSMYGNPEYKWRQIEELWLVASDQLGIAINSYTNNTSLVIAMEFINSGKVLLFPADAQSGNWLSWHDTEVNEKLDQHGGKKTDLLLKNTVFYKVGHHGSHNGTASEHGLEMMTNPNLVAMMPLVEAKVPARWGGSDNFPAAGLYTELIEKTRGALIRTDHGLVMDENAESLRGGLTDEMRDKLKNVTYDLYQEWTVDS